MDLQYSLVLWNTSSSPEKEFLEYPIYLSVWDSIGRDFSQSCNRQSYNTCRWWSWRGISKNGGISYKHIEIILEGRSWNDSVDENVLFKESRNSLERGYDDLLHPRALLRTCQWNHEDFRNRLLLLRNNVLTNSMSERLEWEEDVFEAQYCSFLSSISPRLDLEGALRFDPLNHYYVMHTFAGQNIRNALHNGYTFKLSRCKVNSNFYRFIHFVPYSRKMMHGNLLKVGTVPD